MARNYSVVSKLDKAVGQAVVHKQGIQDRAEHTALGDIGAKGCDGSKLYHKGSIAHMSIIQVYGAVFNPRS